MAALYYEWGHEVADRVYDISHNYCSEIKGTSPSIKEFKKGIFLAQSGPRFKIMGCPIDPGKIYIPLFHKGMQIPLKRYGTFNARS